MLGYKQPLLPTFSMCFSYSIHKNPGQFSLPFDTENLTIPTPGFFFHGFTHPHLPICTANEKWESARWGLIPSWATQDSQKEEIQNVTLNARSETAFEKPAFRNAWSKNPCIVLATGFFEWQHRGKERIPHFIYSKDHPFMFFAGLYEDTRSTEGWQRTYTILTCDSLGIMSEIHNVKQRMPVFLKENQLQQWLHGTPQERLELCRPQHPEFLTAHESDPLLNKNNLNRNQSWAVEPYQKPQTQLLF